MRCTGSEVKGERVQSGEVKGRRGEVQSGEVIVVSVG